MIVNNKKTGFGIKHIVISFFYLGIISAPVPAEDSGTVAQRLINQMSRAARELNYDGIFIYRRGGQMDTLRLIHRNSADGETERLVSLTGHAREIIRNKQSVTCIFPDNKAVMVEKSRQHKFLSSMLPEPVEQIAEYYDFSVTGEDRVAGRMALIVSIKPRDRFRYGYRLWIDKDHHLLLGSELNNDSDQPVEQILFTSMAVLNVVPDELLSPSVSSNGYTWYNNTSGKQDTNGNKRNVWQARWMPGGFNMSDYEQKIMVGNGNAMEHLVYTDGLAMVSVFIEKLVKQSQFAQGPSRMGAVNAFARVSNGYQVTAIGEVPETTVQRMAISIVSNQ